MGGSKKTTKTKRTTQNLLPEYMRGGSERAVQMATDRTNQDYQAYGEQRIADMSQNEQMGVQMARDNQNVGREDFDRAGMALDSIGSFTDEGVAGKYMNPYMEQVANVGLRRKNEAFEAERASRRQGRGMGDAFGGRGDMWDNKFQSDFKQSQDDYMTGAMGSAYDAATRLHGSEQDRSINQASAYSDLAQQRSTQARGQLRDLMATGLTERTRDQADMDFKYLEHLEARDWDVSNLNTLVQTLGGVPHETTQKVDEKITEETKANPMKAIAGVAMIAGAAIMTGGAALANPALWTAAGSMIGGE